MTILLGVDIGTSRIKALAHDAGAGRAVALASRPTPVEHPQPGFSEHDPDALWVEVAACLREVTAAVAEQTIAGLGIASFAEAGCPFDADMQPLYPIIAWHDRRSEAQAAALEAQINAEALHAITGQRVSPSFGVTKWLWIAEHHPEVAARTAHWLSTPDIIHYRLTGALATDRSIASRTLLLDQASGDWSPRMLALAGLRAEQLPAVYPGSTIVGMVSDEAAAASGVPAGTPCALGGHDHLAAGAAAGAVAPGAVVDSTGTAQAVIAVAPGFRSTPGMAAAGYACYGHVLPDQYVVKAGLKLAGGAIEWLAEQLAGPGASPAGLPYAELPYAELERAAAEGIGQRAGPLWLPHLLGSGTPQGDRHSRAALIGLTAAHDRGDIFRGMLESLAFWLRANLEEMAALIGESPTIVTLVGGAHRLGLLAQLKADVLNRPVAVPDMPQAAATGAALLAGLGVGAYPDAAAAAKSLTYARPVIEPDPRRAAFYDELYARAYRPLYDALRGVNHALTDLDTPYQQNED